MSAYSIEWIHLSLIAVPLAVVIFLYIRWVSDAKTLMYATARMLGQLLLVGYVLKFLFESGNAWISSGVLGFMIAVAAWIALRPLPGKRKTLYLRTLLALVLGGVPVLMLVVLGVVRLSPWYMPRYLIPLAGMIFANGMNSISLCAERLCAELRYGSDFQKARAAAYRAGLLPLTNSFFAVGLVSIPGMMTGQILSGVSPLLAVRYQIMVMCMLMGGCGISSALFLYFVKQDAQRQVSDEISAGCEE